MSPYRFELVATTEKAWMVRDESGKDKRVIALPKSQCEEIGVLRWDGKEYLDVEVPDWLAEKEGFA